MRERGEGERGRVCQGGEREGREGDCWPRKRPLNAGFHASPSRCRQGRRMGNGECGDLVLAFDEWGGVCLWRHD